MSRLPYVHQAPAICEGPAYTTDASDSDTTIRLSRGARPWFSAPARSLYVREIESTAEWDHPAAIPA